MEMRFSLVRWIFGNGVAGLIGTMLIITAFQPASLLRSVLLPGLLLGITQALLLPWQGSRTARMARRSTWAALVLLGVLSEGTVRIFLYQWLFLLFGFGTTSLTAGPFVLLVGSLSAVVIGALVGLGQGFLLRSEPFGFRDVRSWIVASAVGWALSITARDGGLFLVISAPGDASGGGMVASAIGVLLLLSGWALYGVVTGTLLGSAREDPRPAMEGTGT